MNLNYLDEVLKIREREIKEGKNLSTRQPIYVVLSLREQYCEGHDEYIHILNNKGKESIHGYVDTSLDSESMEFSEISTDMEEPKEVTQFWIDEVIAFFLTSEAAHDYTKYQLHNMHEPYVYVFYSGYGNLQMDKLLNNS